MFTHDSIGLGEDGHPPTRRAVNGSARHAEPAYLRPCDAVESAIAWKQAVKQDSGPTALVFSRQRCPPKSPTRSTSRVRIAVAMWPGE